MKKIIACTDFSNNAKVAVDYAFALAQYYKAELVLIHSYLVPVPVSEVPPSTEMFEQAKQTAEEYINKLKEELQLKNIAVVPITIYIENENLLLCLQEYCKKNNPDLVVLGTRGQRDIVDVLVGSNTMKLINHLTYPLFVVPACAKFNPFKKIGFACDFEKVVETTPVDLIKELVEDFNAELFVLNVDYQNKHFTAETPEESMLLDHLLFKLKPRYQFLEGKDMPSTIDEFAQKNGLDLLITIPKTHVFFERFFKGTHTRQLIYHTHIPLLCVHEK
ncbi:MAG: universal stress protein [Sphingobacteriales bacterium]|nr:universal stress protein [Sphingobacteriales bacterium]MBI3720308.1 universal stress protein [Sphingobacteriales bacterium]